MAEPLNHLQVGQLVRSRAGRDQGRYYLVFKAAPAGRKVWLVDGYDRTAANPKPKNPRHLQRSRRVSAEFAAGAQAGSLTPELMRACLNSLLADNASENPDEEALANV